MAEAKQAGSKQAKPKKDAGAKQASTKPKKLLNGGVDPAVGQATQFQPGESGNPAGKPKGTKHLSTWIQELLNDENFKATIRRGLEIVDYEGAPIKAIIQAQIILALNGDTKAFDTLAKRGYGDKLEVTGADGEALIPVVRIIDERTTTGNPDSK